MDWLKHAFAVDAPGPAVPTPPQEEAVERVCAEIRRRHLTAPAVLFLETFRPLSYVGSQVLHFFRPIVSAVLDGESIRHFAEFLERRGSVDHLVERIEAPAPSSAPRP